MSLDLTLRVSEFNFKMDKPNDHKVYEFEDFRLDAVHLMLYRQNEEIPLAPKAIDTLLALMERRGEILSKDELMSIIWADSFVEESNLAQYLHILRKTLGDQKSGKPFIETLRRRGYRFNGEVTVADASNGNLPQRRRDAEENKNGSLDAAKTNRPGLRVQRRGNVLALADWRENEIQPLPETETTQQAESVPGSTSPDRKYFIAAAVFAAILTASLSVVWFRSSSNAKTPAAKNEVAFTNLTDGENVDYATISPDGNYFVYVSHDGDKAHLMLQQTGQSSPLEITEPIAGSILATSFTPDSQFIYFVVYQGSSTEKVLYRIPTLGGVRTKILTDAAIAMPSFSPDGKEMVFMRFLNGTKVTSLMIASSDGTNERTIFTVSEDDAKALFGGGAWSPDGRTIAFGLVDLKRSSEGPCEIMGIDPQSGVTKPLSTEKWDNCFRMAWTQDSQGLVFIGTKAKEALSTRRDQIYYISLPNGESRRISTDGSRHQPVSLGVTRKDEILAVPFKRLSQIWSMDSGGDANTALQITRGQADGRGGIEPLADGRIAYLTRNGDGFSIWTMNSDGSDRKQLTTEPSAIEELRAAPDGRFFTFASKTDGRSHLYRVDADGGNLKQLTFGESNEVDSTVSPDGSWIIYQSTLVKDNSERSELWKISSDGGVRVRLGDIACSAPNYSPDGKYISCVSSDLKNISIISAETGTLIKALKTIGQPILNIGTKWTPDSKAVAYIDLHSNINNIRVQPLNDDPAHLLTNFTSGDIYNFAFSNDGARLFAARGYPTRNAVLIKKFR